jgi:hypothetical protein
LIDMTPHDAAGLRCETPVSDAGFRNRSRRQRMPNPAWQADSATMTATITHILYMTFSFATLPLARRAPRNEVRMR